VTASPVHLGDVLAMSERSSTALTAWLDGEHAALRHRLEHEAAQRGETLAQFVRASTADFLAEADEVAWASLLSAIREADDPGAACIARMAELRLRARR
jgi:hypothetical protein